VLTLVPAGMGGAEGLLLSGGLGRREHLGGKGGRSLGGPLGGAAGGWEGGGGDRLAGWLLVLSRHYSSISIALG